MCELREYQAGSKTKVTSALREHFIHKFKEIHNIKAQVHIISLHIYHGCQSIFSFGTLNYRNRYRRSQRQDCGSTARRLVKLRHMWGKKLSKSRYFRRSPKI